MEDNLFIKTTKERKRKNWKKIAVIVFVIVVFIVSASVVIGVSGFYNHMRAAEIYFSSAKEEAGKFNFEQAQEDVIKMSAEIEAAKNDLKYAKLAFITPYLGPQLRAADHMATVAIDSAQAVDSLLSAAVKIKKAIADIPALEDSNNGEIDLEEIADNNRVYFLQALASSADNFITAKAELDLAANELEKVKNINGINGNIEILINSVDKYLQSTIKTIDFLIPISQTLADLSGINEPKQWLVLFLNNTELRPGGGFIGVYGILQVENGQIKDFYTDDSYLSVDEPAIEANYQMEPPGPLKKYLGVNNWYFRDANWSPDFAESAQNSVELYQQELRAVGKPAPDIVGVIGITPDLVEDILDLVGPVNIRGIEFDSENVTELLEYYVEYGFEDLGLSRSERKVTVGELAETVLGKLADLPFSQWSALLSVLQNNIAQKHIMIYALDSEVENIFVEQGWGARIETPAEGGDALMLVDANLGALKTDHAMERKIDYKISKKNGKYYATATITYQHNGESDWRTSRYQTYARWYAPMGSYLVSASFAGQEVDLSSFDYNSDLGMAVFGHYFTVSIGQTAQLVLTYELPDNISQSVLAGYYNLNIYKQPGTDNYPLTLNLDFDKRITAAYPSEERENYGDDIYVWRGEIDRDSRVQISF